MLLKHPVVGRMLNRTTILQRVSISTVAHRFMVGTRTDAVRTIPSVRGIETTANLMGRLFGRTFNSAIVLKTACREIQAYESKDGDLIGNPPPKPSTKPLSDTDNTKLKVPNPMPNRT
jgi:hypothetical protein